MTLSTRDCFRFHRLRVHSTRPPWTPTLQMPIIIDTCTSDQLAINRFPWTPLLGWINLLEQLAELRKSLYSLDQQFIVKGYNSSQTSFTAWMLPVEREALFFGGKACALGCASTTFTPLFSAFALVAVCQTSAPWLCVMWAFCTERRGVHPEAQPLLGERNNWAPVCARCHPH